LSPKLDLWFNSGKPFIPANGEIESCGKRWEETAAAGAFERVVVGEYGEDGDVRCVSLAVLRDDVDVRPTAPPPGIDACERAAALDQSCPLLSLLERPMPEWLFRSPVGDERAESSRASEDEYGTGLRADNVRREGGPGACMKPNPRPCVAYKSPLGLLYEPASNSEDIDGATLKSLALTLCGKVDLGEGAMYCEDGWKSETGSCVPSPPLTVALIRCARACERAEPWPTDSI